MLPGIKLFDLKDRVALITGGSKGLGQAMAAGLASAGANVMLVSRNGHEAEAAAAEIASEYGVKAIGMAVDVTQQADVDAMIENVESTFGRLDILINNAGINIRGPINDLDYEEFRKVQDINVDGVWRCCKAAGQLLQSSPAGRVINMASTLGLVGLSERTPYTTSKGAVVQMTRGLALEWARHQVTVNAICPGPFLTPMNEPIAETEQAKKFIVGATALERWGKMEEIQGAAIFLASDAGSYMTGSMLTVDGGWTAR